MADPFKILGITLPDFIDDEARRIVRLLDNGIDRIHIRKPEAQAEAIARLLEDIPESLHCRLSLHDHHELIARFPQVWAHANARNPEPPVQVPFSRSCHKLDELCAEPCAQYSFLSPIFDSISKHGYGASFTTEQLKEAARAGIINQNVIALGGVTPDRFPILKSLGFGGAAMLGYIWNTH